MLTMNIEFILEFDCSFYARCSLCTSALPNLAMQVAKVLRYVLVKASWYYLTCQVKKVNFMHTGVCRNMAMQQKDLVDEQIYRVTRKGCY